MKTPTRGQATLELAVGLLVFITVLIAGIHFGEISHLGLKVHEAAASASWDATSYRVERPGANGVDPAAWYDTNRLATPLINSNGAARYANWDGRSSKAGSSAPRQLFTHARAMAASCATVASPNTDFQIDDTAVTPAYGNPGVLSCTASGTIDTINVPSGYHQQSSGGYFKADHLRTVPLTMCAFGRASFGQCLGGLPLLLGDHGLSVGNAENAECGRLPSDQGVLGAACANPTFYRLAHENWDRSMPYTGAPEAFARSVTGRAPTGRVSGFYMSFRGEESGFVETDTKGWQTSPMDHAPGGTYRTAYTERAVTAVGDGMGFLYAGRYRCD